jgi:modulator of FtsH protease HflK
MKASDFDMFKDEIKIPKLKMSSVGPIIWVAIIVIVLLWLIGGGPFYTVGPDEEGVVLRFGKYNRSESPGFHFKWPAPIESVYKPKVTEVKRVELGFRTSKSGATGQAAQYRSDLEEALMLTGDENLIQVNIIVQYQIKNAVDFLFEVNDVNGTLRDVASAVTRQKIGDYGIDVPLTSGKAEIEAVIEKQLQEIADLYRMGTRIVAVQLQDVDPPVEVADAFKAVASARENKNKYINEARGYQNGRMPRAEGDAAKLVREAEAYKSERVQIARGEVEKFSAVLKEYQNAKEVTRARLYLETMEKILPNKKKVIIDSGNDGVLKLLDLTSEKLKGGQK